MAYWYPSQHLKNNVTLLYSSCNGSFIAPGLDTSQQWILVLNAMHSWKWHSKLIFLLDGYFDRLCAENFYSHFHECIAFRLIYTTFFFIEYVHSIANDAFLFYLEEHIAYRLGARRTYKCIEETPLYYSSAPIASKCSLLKNNGYPAPHPSLPYPTSP